MKFDTQALHADFPHLAERCYLNTAAAGLSWSGQGSAAAEFYDLAKARGMNGRSEWQQRLQTTQQRVRALLGDFNEHLEFFSSTTEVLNLVAHSLEGGPGDEIVVAADEFPSMLHAWQAAQLCGASVVAVPVNDEATRTSLLCEAITERTRVVAVSHVHWVTGTMVDLQQIGRHCHAHDALLVVDGIQAMGATPVSLDGVDVYCGAVFKWLLSGFGLSIAALTQRALDRLQPAYVGYANAPPEQGLRYAHVNYPGIYALNAALEHLEGYGWPDIYARVASLVERLVAGVERLGYVVAAPVRARAGIVSIAPPEAASLRHALARDGIDVEERAGFLRCSPHFYNTEEDIDRLLAALPRASSSSV